MTSHPSSVVQRKRAVALCVLSSTSAATAFLPCLPLRAQSPQPVAISALASDDELLAREQSRRRRSRFDEVPKDDDKIWMHSVFEFKK